MDYIQEELLRARALLTALLSSGTAERPEDKTTTAIWQASQPDTLDAAGLSGVSVPAGETADTRNTARASALAAARSTAAEAESGGGISTTAELSASATAAARQLAAQSAENRRRAALALGLSADGITGNRSGGAGTVGFRVSRAASTSVGQAGAGETAGRQSGVSGSGAALSARELSQTYERDARRYDGGYPLY